MKDIQKAGRKLETLRIEENGFSMVFCKEPIGIEKSFSENVRKLSFPPDGIAEICELDYFYTIIYNNKIIGYYKAVDLFFDGEIEIHGSYDGPHTFLIKNYFLLSKKFVMAIYKMFPKKKITTMVHSSNKKVLPIMKWLGFIPVENYDYSPYNKYILQDPNGQ